MGPSFQRTLRDLEGKERQIQMLLRSVQQAQEEETAYQLSFRLAAACEQATLLARALPAYTGRLRAFQEVGGMVCETVPMDIGFTQEGWFCLRIPFLLPKKGDRLYRLCAVLGVSVPAPVLPADPAAPVQPLCADLPPCLCQGQAGAAVPGPRQHRNQHGGGRRDPLHHGRRWPQGVQPLRLHRPGGPGAHGGLRCAGG